MRADEATKTAVNDLLERFADAYESKNVDSLMSLFKPDPNMLNLGPEKEEMNVGAAQLKESMGNVFKEAESINLKYGWTSIKANGDVAWVASHVTYTIKKVGKLEVSESARFTAVFEKEKDNWLFVQHHLSFAKDIEAEDEPKKEGEEAKAEEAKAEETKAEEEKPEEKSEDDVFYEIP